MHVDLNHPLPRHELKCNDLAVFVLIPDGAESNGIHVGSLRGRGA
jgi:hypothetical protein